MKKILGHPSVLHTVLVVEAHWSSHHCSFLYLYGQMVKLSLAAHRSRVFSGPTQLFPIWFGLVHPITLSTCAAEICSWFYKMAPKNNRGTRKPGPPHTTYIFRGWNNPEISVPIYKASCRGSITPFKTIGSGPILYIVVLASGFGGESCLRGTWQISYPSVFTNKSPIRTCHIF